MAEKQDKKAIYIPLDLYELIQKKVSGKGFSTPDDFVVYTLRIILGKGTQSIESIDEEKVMEQLRAMGYV